MQTMYYIGLDVHKRTRVFRAVVIAPSTLDVSVAHPNVSSAKLKRVTCNSMASSAASCSPKFVDGIDTKPTHATSVRRGRCETSRHG